MAEMALNFEDGSRNYGSMTRVFGLFPVIGSEFVQTIRSDAGS